MAELENDRMIRWVIVSRNTFLKYIIKFHEDNGLFTTISTKNLATYLKKQQLTACILPQTPRLIHIPLPFKFCKIVNLQITFWID